jgi:hypothetical protein
MKNKIFFLVLLTTLVWSATPHQPTISEKYTLSVCALFKNETKYLKEWIEYHRLIGVDHFYLYNTKSTDRPLHVLLPYIKQGVVTLIFWPEMMPAQGEDSPMWALTTQISAYENGVRIRGKNETEWMILLNVDEFLVPSEEISLKALLKKCEGFCAIALHQAYFDAAEVSMAQNRLVIETKEMIAPVKVTYTGIEKLIFKPAVCESFNWPPYTFTFANNQLPVKIAKHQLHINRYLHRFKEKIHFENSKQSLKMDSRLLTDEELQLLLKQDYKIEDQESEISRHIPQMRKLMEFE